MATFRHRPFVVSAVQWQPGVAIDGLITDPKDLIGIHWAHLGHQREVSPQLAILDVGKEGLFVGPSDWIVADGNGRRWVMTDIEFQRTYEAVDA